jgi:hypothetical protein
VGKIGKLYSTYVANFLTRGELVLQKKMSSLSIRTVYSFIITKKAATKVFAIVSLPVDLQTNVTSYVRHEMYKRAPYADVTVVLAAKKADLSVGRESFNRQFSRTEERYVDYEEAFKKATPSQRQTGINLGRGVRLWVTSKELKKRKDKYFSFRYLSEHGLTGGKFFRTNYFIQVSCRTIDQTNNARKILEEILASVEVLESEVASGTSDYLKAFGPAGYKEEARKDMPPILLSDENLSRLIPSSTRGLIGGKGILFGIDILSALPLILNPFATSSAQVMLLVAKAGHGKTLLATMLSIAFMAYDVHVSILDYKGKEYVKADFAVDPLVIDMTSSTGLTVNILRLDDLDVDEEDCTYIYDLTINSMIEKLVIISRIGGSKFVKDIELVFKSATTKLFSSLAGFNMNNPKTFYLTSKLREDMVLPILSEMVNSPSSKAIKSELERALGNLKTYYLGVSGSREYRLVDVINHKCVIYSLNKNANTALTSEEAVKVFDMQHLSRKKHYFRSKLKLHTVEAYEELTQVEENATNSDVYSDGKRILLYISKVVTAARSDNVSVLMMCNNLTSFNSPMMAPIRSNLTTVMAGRMTEEDVDTLVDNFDCRSIEPYVRQIATGRPKYQNCFAIKFENGNSIVNTIFKAVPPDYMEEKLRQRDVIPT